MQETWHAKVLVGRVVGRKRMLWEAGVRPEHVWGPHTLRGTTEKEGWGTGRRCVVEGKVQACLGDERKGNLP